MKLYILDNGWMECDENWIVCLNSYKTKTNREATSRWIKIPVYCVLIDTGNEKILFDTGQNPNEYDRSIRCPYYYREEQLLINQLKSLHLEPTDIDKVILSHFHDDHCGNMDMFKSAEFYIAQDEYNYVKEALDNHQKPKGAYKYAHLNIEKIHLVKEDIKIHDHIQLINLPGHSKGLLGMIVHLEKEGTLLFPSDAVDTHLNYGPPAMPQYSQYNLEKYYESIEKIRNLQERLNAKIIFSHDMEQFMTLKKAPDYYE